MGTRFNKFNTMQRAALALLPGLDGDAWLALYNTRTVEDGNGCAVLALAAVLGTDYMTVYRALGALGRAHSAPTPRPMTLALLARAGCEIYELTPSVPLPVCMLWQGHVPDRLRTGRYLIGLDGHIQALVDGRVLDSPDVILTQHSIEPVDQLFQIVLPSGPLTISPSP